MGAEGVERELKLAVPNAAALDALARAAERRGATVGERIRQTNTLFDTPAHELRADDILVRLRAEASSAGIRYCITLKGRLREEGTGLLHARREEEVTVGPEVARAVLAGKACILSAFAEQRSTAGPLLGEARARAAAGLVPIGSFVNARTRVGPLDAAGCGVYLELDETTLADGAVRHEVELELPGDPGVIEAGQALLRDLCAEAGVEGTPAPPKSALFLASLRPNPPTEG